MTTKQAIKIVKNDIQIVESVSGFQINDLPLFDALQHLIDIAQRYEGAVEVQLKTDPYAGVSHCWIQSVHNPGKTPKKYTLYAVPK